jgi:hypothetical protein
MLCSETDGNWPGGANFIFLVHNEQTKLTANICNTLATSLVAAGGFAPAIAFLYGISRPEPGAIQISLVTFACFGGAAFLHFLGRRMLGRLRE